VAATAVPVAVATVEWSEAINGLGCPRPGSQRTVVNRGGISEPERPDLIAGEEVSAQDLRESVVV
jgi:hypothetical protein